MMASVPIIRGDAARKMKLRRLRKDFEGCFHTVIDRRECRPRKGPLSKSRATFLLLPNRGSISRRSASPAFDLISCGACRFLFASG